MIPVLRSLRQEYLQRFKPSLSYMDEILTKRKHTCAHTHTHEHAHTCTHKYRVLSKGENPITKVP